MAARHVPETRDPDATGRLDFRGAILAAVGLAAVTYALIQAGDDSSSLGATLAIAAFGVVSLVAFIFAEHQAPLR